MKERPILFSIPMVQAILAGKKTMTRRIVKDTYQAYPCVTKHITSCEFDFHFEHGNGQFTPCPYGRPGDRLWVRETFAIDFGGSYIYKAWPMFNDGEPVAWDWKPSIYMPRSASRIMLEITDVRVERLQNISEQDAIAEGLESKQFERIYPISKQGKFTGYKLYYPNVNDYDENPINSFWSLWDKINGDGAFQSNPWVWVIEFKVLQPAIEGR